MTGGVGMERRAMLRLLFKSGGVLAAVAAIAPLSACLDDARGGEAAPDGGMCPPPGWIEVSLQKHPTLEQVGGAAVVEDPSSLLNVHVIRLDDARVAVVWRVCSHGACLLDYDAAARELVCPCHGSRFDLDGRVQSGPATEDVRALRAVLCGESLWIEPLL